MKRVSLLLLLAVIPPALCAQMYRWVDDKGQVHYTQTPPPGRKATPVAPAPPPSEGGNQKALNKALEADIKDRPKRAEEAAKAAQEQARKQENCRQAQERLKSLDASTARRLMVQDEKGQPARMTEEQFQQKRAEAQQQISENCS